ncbi:MAG: sensor histidine kinase [Saprospiraceae bacterium]
MKKILTTHQWIILLATIALSGIGLIQANWIYEGHRLKLEEMDLRLRTLTPELAKQLKNKKLFSNPDLLSVDEPIPMDSIELVIDSMLKNKGIFSDYFYAVFQKKENGIYKSNTNKFERELKSSNYEVCISCIITFNFVKQKVDLDTLTAESLKKINQEIRPGMTTIRSLEETLKTKEESEEEILWFSLHIPNQFILAVRAIFSQLAMTVFLMGLLMGLFIYTLRALEKQKKLSQVKDDFFNNMTHEFKTPLSSIRLASAVLKKNEDKTKKEIYLNVIENESKKLEGQVDKILQLSLIESNEMTLEKENVDIHFLVKEVIDRLKLIVDQKEATINLKFCNDDFWMKGDATHLSNCIYNLVENALKYSGDFPEITISTFFENGKKVISIKDKGKGIPKEFQSEIFDRFFRAQKNDQYKGKGFGIGLSYVKAIVEAHDGKIILNEAYKNGCEFVISF